MFSLLLLLSFRLNFWDPITKRVKLGCTMQISRWNARQNTWVVFMFFMCWYGCLHRRWLQSLFSVCCTCLKAFNKETRLYAMWSPFSVFFWLPQDSSLEFRNAVKEGTIGAGWYISWSWRWLKLFWLLLLYDTEDQLHLVSGDLHLTFTKCLFGSTSNNKSLIEGFTWREPVIWKIFLFYFFHINRHRTSEHYFTCYVFFHFVGYVKLFIYGIWCYTLTASTICSLE